MALQTHPPPHPPPTKVYKSPSTSNDEALYYSTIYHNSRDLGTPEKAGEAPPLTPGVLRTPSVQMGILTLVTWVPQNRQGKLHLSLRGCSAPPPFCRRALHQGQPLRCRAFLLLTRGADNSRPNYTAPSCPTEQCAKLVLHTFEEGGGPMGCHPMLTENANFVAMHL